jgi:hypothetical protein
MLRFSMVQTVTVSAFGELSTRVMSATLLKFKHFIFAFQERMLWLSVLTKRLRVPKRGKRWLTKRGAAARARRWQPV